MADKVELLIAEVEKNKFLYDLREKDYKDVKRKNDVWKEIALRVGFESAESACKKWTNIKDAYVQYTKKLKTRSGQALPGRFTKYKWADQLQFLNDCTVVRRSSSNLDFLEEEDNFVELDLSAEETEQIALSLITPEDTGVATEYAELTEVASLAEEPIAIRNNRTPQSKTCKRKVKEVDVNAEIMQYLSSKKPKDQPKAKSALELFFQAKLETVKTFPPSKQLEVKRKMTEIIFNIEEELLGEE